MPKNALQKLWYAALDLVFPKKPHIAALEDKEWYNLRALLPKAENSLSAHNIYPLFNYSHEKVRAVVWDIKYKRNPRLAEALAKLLHEEMLETIADMELFDGGSTPLLVPIPMSYERKKKRGFNQTEFLAELVWKQSGGALAYTPHALAKVCHTKPQADLKRAERLENLKGVYRVEQPEAVARRNIILLDDVSTTGATLREASRTLKAAGAREIIAFTIAH